MKETIKALLSEAKSRQGMTNEQLAELSGMAVGTVASVLSGRGSVSSLIKLCGTLGVELFPTIPPQNELITLCAQRHAKYYNKYLTTKPATKESNIAFGKAQAYSELHLTLRNDNRATAHNTANNE